jgi:hypothetical protein
MILRVFRRLGSIFDIQRFFRKFPGWNKSIDKFREDTRIKPFPLHYEPS